MTVLEENLAVNDYRFKGVLVWPYIKVSIYIKMLGLVNRKKSSTQAVRASNPQMHRLRMYLGNLKRFFHTLTALWQSSVVILAPEAHNNVMAKGAVLNRSTYGMNKCFEAHQQRAPLNLEYNDEHSFCDTPKKYPAWDISFFVFALNELCRSLIKRTQHRGDAELHYVDEINQCLEEAGLPIALKKHSLYWELKRVFWLSSVFRALFWLLRTKKLVVVCFYNAVSISATKAAHELGIETIEYQHGIQNSFQPMYNNWLNVPERGYDWIPRQFHVWSESNARNVETWTGLTKGHSVKVVGNAFIENYIQDCVSRDNPYAALRSDFERVILITLQNEDYFPVMISEVIDALPDSWCWVFKEHPHNKIQHVRGLDLSDLKARKNVVWVEQGDAYQLLDVTDVHATAFSTVAFEALAFEVPTVFYHEVATECFAGQLDNMPSFRVATQTKAAIDAFQYFAGNQRSAASNAFVHYDGSDLLREELSKGERKCEAI